MKRYLEGFNIKGSEQSVLNASKILKDAGVKVGVVNTPVSQTGQYSAYVTSRSQKRISTLIKSTGAYIVSESMLDLILGDTDGNSQGS